MAGKSRSARHPRGPTTSLIGPSPGRRVSGCGTLGSTVTMASLSTAPTTRSRTLLFFSYRDSSARPKRPMRLSQYDAYTQEGDEAEGLMSEGAGPSSISLDNDLPPKWYVISILCLPYLVTLHTGQTTQIKYRRSWPLPRRRVCPF